MLGETYIAIGLPVNLERTNVIAVIAINWAVAMTARRAK